MHDALGDPLMIEVSDLFPENKVFEKRRTAKARLERGLVVRARDTLIRRQHASAGIDADAIERRIAGVEARLRVSAAYLLGGIDLGQRTSRNERMRGLDCLAHCGVTRRVSKLTWLAEIERE